MRPDALPALAAETETRLAALAESADTARLAQRAAEAEASYRALAGELSAKRELAAHDLEARVTEVMQGLAMAGGRLEIALEPLAMPASYGVEERRVSRREPSEAAARAAREGRLGRRGCRGSRCRSRW